MEFSVFYSEIKQNLPEILIKENEPLSKHTSFRIGGPARLMLFPRNGNELSVLLRLCKKYEQHPVILGAGTNVLAPDSGIDAPVICLKDSIDGIQLLDVCRIQVAAGVTMTRAAVYAATNNLGGMEFAHGIPGTVGGGVYMNAGAYGGQISDICESVTAVDMDGEIHEFPVDQLDFSYRHSRLEDEALIVVSAVFKLYYKPENEVRNLMQELASRRKSSQPLDLPSAGSAFKRPVGGYAAALIDQVGLKGKQFGGAAVSEKHAGFVVNLGGATAEDVKELLAYVAKVVHRDTGIMLEPEIRIW